MGTATAEQRVSAENVQVSRRAAEFGSVQSIDISLSSRTGPGTHLRPTARIIHSDRHGDPHRHAARPVRNSLRPGGRPLGSRADMLIQGASVGPYQIVSSLGAGG